MKFLKRMLFLVLSGVFASPELVAQGNQPAATGALTLEQCLELALQNRPVMQQARIDEQITDREIKAELAAWLPQVGVAGNVQHYLKMPVTIFPNEAGVLVPRQIGTVNSSNLSLVVDQVIFNNDVFFASRGSRYLRRQSEQNTYNEKINTIVEVSRAYYDVLLSEEQLKILDQDIIRQEKQLKDARAQYEQGLVDKTDYQRADISLTNVRSTRKRTLEAIKPKYTFLKELIGYPADKDFQLTFDRDKKLQYMLVDTLQPVNYDNRIEFRQLQTQKQIQQLSVDYYKWSFVPSFSAFFSYNIVYQNNDFQQLYNQSYPNSPIGLSMSVPLFTGTRRLQELKRARLIDKRLDLDIVNIKNRINTEYEAAMATYRSDLYELKTVERNVATAEEVYRIIKLQYDEGIKPYLDLILAEAEIRATQLNYYNALYRVLTSKLEVERVTGTINVAAYEQK
ncbi:TolC family protein [Adhaeribacter sp. BT258]|uniref:TolC family protein n=1 Tax=Adhaeribacter terrigena TaxID=2793070 RepID=A0ABS1C3R9_9BACT|nr:TolC family protein [Adhaeribacter terrigena]MBK0403190.1 TolC family protein [Adhaeribacter terrigena]